MPRRRKKAAKGPERKPETDAVDILDAELVDEDDEFYKSVVEPMLNVGIDCVMMGLNAFRTQEVLKQAGYDLGRDKTYRLIRAAKAVIRKRAMVDFDEKYAWAEQNLLDMHAKAVIEGDTRTRGAVIKQLMDLWGLVNTEKAPKQIEITPEQMEQFEQALLR